MLDSLAWYRDLTTYCRPAHCLLPNICRIECHTSNDDAVCRSTQATPGLSITFELYLEKGIVSESPYSAETVDYETFALLK